MSILTPPLKWHGGKHYLARRIVALMPRHLHYVEPFFGGGQVFFLRDPGDPRLWWDGPTSDGSKAEGVSEVLNDIDDKLMNFYAVLKDPEAFARLRDLLELTLFSEAEWEAAGESISGPSGDSVERAAALFTSVRQSMSGRRGTFSPTTRTRLRGGRNADVNAWWTAVEGLQDVHERLRNARVICKPALGVIRSEDTPGTLFYCDPPYLHATRTARDVYGSHEMTDADHLELLQALRRVQGKVMLSGYPSELYDRELAGWTRHAFDLANHAAGGKAKARETEVVWCNF